jgi:hypothetical protein
MPTDRPDGIAAEAKNAMWMAFAAGLMLGTLAGVVIGLLISQQ